MNLNMKTAFRNYFTKLDLFYKSTFGTKPTVPYSENLNKELTIGSPDEEGEIQWEPKEQDLMFDWKPVESKLGFLLCQELKDFYNTFFFLSLSGIFQDCELNFYAIDGSLPLEKIVMQNYKDALYLFSDTQYFLIGSATVNDDDNYFIYFDNDTKDLFCYESDTGNKVLLSNSIVKIIGEMEASL